MRVPFCHSSVEFLRALSVASLLELRDEAYWDSSPIPYLLALGASVRCDYVACHLRQSRPLRLQTFRHAGSSAVLLEESLGFCDWRGGFLTLLAFLCVLCVLCGSTLPLKFEPRTDFGFPCVLSGESSCLRTSPPLILLSFASSASFAVKAFGPTAQC